MRWAILYRDGSMFSSDDGEPHEAPRTEVQAVFQEVPDELVRAIIIRSTWGFWKWEGAWVGVDREGMWQHQVHYPHPLVLFGSFLTEPDWAEMKVTIEDTLNVVKGAWLRRERGLEDVS